MHVFFQNFPTFADKLIRLTSTNWFVFYTKSRHEKKVRDLLLRSGYEVFLPMQTVMRQWTDRKKKVEVPLFNSYLFVKTAESQVVDVLNTPGVSTVIRHNGKPAVLRDVEYEMIKRFITSGLFLETSSYDHAFLPGDRAEVIGGPLAGTQGVVSGPTNEQKFAVLLEGIHQVIRVDIDSSFLKKIAVVK